ncbi:prepro-urotensin II-beta isoform X2 [Electrophorus electricus]|uniref:prepro-urotensin II-beta isoform X2 n=1 Tax=Electrophorus electricus TaxID=8005 RepID=UPI0015D0A4D3|nr:prepro-urotensin II-beta isoform X2 [Electrophorus electricus]
MLCKLLLSCSLLFFALEPLPAHPFIHSDMPYTGPVSDEDEQTDPGERLYPALPYPSWGAGGIGYPSLLRGDINREGLRAAGPFLSRAVEVLLGRVSRERPLVQVLGGRKPYKRGSSTDCFWKYCV